MQGSSVDQRHPLTPQEPSVSFPALVNSCSPSFWPCHADDQGFSLQHQVSLLTCRGHKAGAQGSDAGGASGPFPAWRVDPREELGPLLMKIFVI